MNYKRKRREFVRNNIEPAARNLAEFVSKHDNGAGIIYGGGDGGSIGYLWVQFQKAAVMREITRNRGRLYMRRGNLSLYQHLSKWD